MSTYRNDLNAGTDGNGGLGRITPANSASSGEPFALLVDTSAQRWEYAAHPLGGDGLVAYRTNDTTSAHIRGHDPAPGGRGGMRRSLYLPSAPAASAVIAQIRTAAEANMGSVQVEPSGRIAVNQGAGVGWISASQSGVAPLDTLLTVEFFQTPADPATGGLVELYVFDDTETDIWSWSGNVTTNTAAPAQYRFGGHSSASLPYDWFDDVAWGALEAGTFGPASVASEPQVFYSLDGSALAGASLHYSPDGSTLTALDVI